MATLRLIALLGLLAIAVAVLIAQDRGGSETEPPPEPERARSGPSSCDAYASPQGVDSGTATRRDPVGSAVALVEALVPGEVGCFMPGTYDADDLVRITTPRIALTSATGERARLVGRLWIDQGADGVQVSNLDLNGRNRKTLPSPTVNAHGAVFTNNDVTTEHTSTCFLIGSSDYGRADSVVIGNNRIHNCGELPATNHQHGIYVAQSRGTVIENNAIYGNADRGIQLYPNADETLVTGNVIDGNGQGIIISGGEEETSDDNLVEHNVITNSTIRYNVETHWQGATGTGNVVRENCLFSGDGEAGIEPSLDGASLREYTVADPVYEDRSAAKLAVSTESPCHSILAGAS